MEQAMERSADRPERCNCNHVRRAARRLSRYYDLCMAGTGLKSTQYTLLAYLDTEGPLTMARLADVMAMDRATVGHNLRPLEREGLVQIAVSEADRRARRVSITPHGYATLLAANPAWKKAQAGFETAFGASDAALVRDLMVRVVEAPLPAT